MVPETRVVDSEGRIRLPESFANATVVIEQLSETELRVRKAAAMPEGQSGFVEGAPITVSERDRDRFLEALDRPPEPNDALRRREAPGRARSDASSSVAERKVATIASAVPK